MESKRAVIYARYSSAVNAKKALNAKLKFAMTMLSHIIARNRLLCRPKENRKNRYPDLTSSAGFTKAASTYLMSFWFGAMTASPET